MRKLFLMVGLALVAFACSEQAGQMLVDAGEMMQDAGQQIQDSGTAQAQTVEVDCSKAVNGFVLTDVDQQDFGQVIIHSTWPDPWGVTDPPRNVDYQSDAFWSIDGKVLVQCSGNTIRAWLEIR